ncbi:RDD family protein [Streptomyces sp. JJ66]|uniref:RDD family protein n=1 Tax=Streptomyces sp. JJ66 TaxID=2803843 RepID=UPI001C56FC5E|nr:RDD family protein [Streptomyces sp. JJ66]MBW1601834.1 RDD family protein [Streptomyces sp. JJ66]
MSELVTGDAVVLGLRPARLPSRALAVGIDLVVLFAVYLLLSFWMLTAVGSLDQAALAAVVVALGLLVLVGVPVLVETLSHGRSLGKLACGLRVVRVDGGPIRFRHALVRGLLGFVEVLMTLGMVACVASLVSARGRRLGDVFAGTLVVRERVPVPQQAPPVMPPPPWLAGYFAELDLSRVPDGLWLTVRQYVARAGHFDPQAGAAMAERLAGDVVALTGTAPPQGVPALGYLMGVLAERQVREARRLPGASAQGPVPVPGAGTVTSPAAGRAPELSPSTPGPAQSAPQPAPAAPPVPQRKGGGAGFVPPA